MGGSHRCFVKFNCSTTEVKRFEWKTFKATTQEKAYLNILVVIRAPTFHSEVVRHCIHVVIQLW